MVIILKWIKWKKFLNKFLKGLEYISRNFPQEISVNFSREISELTTIIIILHPCHWSAVLLCTGVSLHALMYCICRKECKLLSLQTSPWHSSITSDVCYSSTADTGWHFCAHSRLSVYAVNLPHFCSCTVIIVNQWFDKNMSCWNFGLT